MNTLPFRFVATGALLAALIVVPAAASANPVVAEDLFKMNYLDNALISPDGTHVLVVSTHMDGPKDTYDSTIDLVDVASGKSIDATHGTSDGDYDWMPDGKSFVFVRTPEKEKSQLFRYTLADDSIVQLTHAKDGVSSPQVSHDGRRILLTVTQTDEPHAAYIDFSKAGFTPTDAQKNTDIHRIDQLGYLVNGVGYVYQDHQHLWTINADGSDLKQLTPGGPFSETGAVWSPDDSTIAFGSLRRETVDGGPNDMYAIPSSGGETRKIPSSQPVNNGLFFSPSGDRYYYWTGGVEDPSELSALAAANLDGSDARTIVPKNTISWGDSLLADMKEGGGPCVLPMPDGKRAVINADGPGYTNLRVLDLQSGSTRNLTPPKGEAWACTMSRDGRTVAYLYSDALHPADLYVADTATGASRPLTHVNDAYLASVTLSVPQEFWVRDAAGHRVQAWFMPATGGSPGAKHPTLLDIHGGPQTQFGDTYFQEFQMWASLGYNVVYADPAGSTGHGHSFEASLNRNWGDAMFEDVQVVMDAAVRRPGVDASRLGVLGGSYGGYATLWVVSHTNRFRAAVAERAVSDLQSEVFAADFASKNGLGGVYSFGVPWEPGNLYGKLSPIDFANHVRTPLMILHSSEDTRTPIDQTLQEFTALKILGQTVQYVDIPGENHDLSRTGAPIHRVERLHLIADWMNRYLNP